MARFSGSLTATLHIFALWTIAVVQPLLDVIGRSPEFFVAHRASASDVLMVVGLITFVPPLAIGGLVGMAAAAGRVDAARGIAVGTNGLLCAAIAVQLLEHGGVSSAVIAVPTALAGGLAAAVVYERIPPVRTALSVLSLLVLVIPLLFLTKREIWHLLTPGATAPTPRAAAPGAEKNDVPVVLVVLDEVPLVSLLDAELGLDERRFPALSSLANDGVWFRNATTVSDLTRTALPAILSGRYPRPHSMPTAADHPQTLFTLLGGSHRMVVQEPVTRLCPPDICRSEAPPAPTRVFRMMRDLSIVYAHVLLTRDLAHLAPDVTATWAHFGERAANGTGQAAPVDPREAFERFIERIEPPGPRPALYFFHSLLSHHPFRYLPTGQLNATRIDLPDRLDAAANQDEWEIAHQQQRHLMQLAFVDTQMARLIDRLKTTGLYHRALIVVASDHGLAFRSGAPLRGFVPDTAGEVMRVPLIVKLPSDARGEPGERQRPTTVRSSDRNVETIDILPTIAGVLGIGVEGIDGVSLTDPKAAPRPLKRILSRFSTVPYEYGHDAPSLEPALRVRIQRFGDFPDVFHFPHPGRFAEVIGRPVTELRVAPGSREGAIARTSLYSNVDPSAPAVPFDVAGRISRAAGDTSPLHVAVAVNGVVRAVSRTWLARPDEWLATVPPAAWKAGANRLDVYVIEGTHSGPVLHAMQRQPRPADLNLISRDAALFWNVRHEGFRSRVRTPHGVLRWTRRRAVVTLPAEWRRSERLHFVLAQPADPSAQVTVSADACVLYSGTVPHRRWRTTFRLDRCPPAHGPMAISLLTEPAKGNATLRRGVGVLRLSAE